MSKPCPKCGQSISKTQKSSDCLQDEGMYWAGVHRMLPIVSIPYAVDNSHAHCIDCGKLYAASVVGTLSECEQCGGLIDFCDSRCKDIRVMTHVQSLGITWEVYRPPMMASSQANTTPKGRDS